MTLLEHLKDFSRVNGNMEVLNKTIESVASHFLYGGYFAVGGKKIFLTDIEFYYHEEGGSVKIHDYIMYHINHKCKDGEFTPFEFGSLHAHVSGIDFTFEDPAGKYRASILIRGARKEGEDKPETRPTYLYDYFLMHNPVFGDGFSIRWHDIDYDPEKDFVKIDSHVRKNVPQYYEHDCDNGKKGERIMAKDREHDAKDELKLGKVTYLQCPREWRYRK